MFRLKSSVAFSIKGGNGVAFYPRLTKPPFRNPDNYFSVRNGNAPSSHEVKEIFSKSIRASLVKQKARFRLLAGYHGVIVLIRKFKTFILSLHF